MAVTVTVNPILPKKLNIAVYQTEILKALVKEGAATRRSYNRTIEGWSGAKPTMESKIEQKGGDVSVFTGPGGNAEGVKKFRFLDEGTRIRHALMSSDWQSKTRPGRLISRGGAGKVVVISKKIRRPGIKARGWTLMIQKTRKRFFPKNVTQAINRAAARSF